MGIASSAENVGRAIQALQSLSDEEVRQVFVPPKQQTGREGDAWKLALRLRRIHFDCGIYYHREINRLCPTIRTILSGWLSNVAWRHVYESEAGAGVRRPSRTAEDTGGRKSPTTGPDSKEFHRLMVERSLLTGNRIDFKSYRTAVRLQTTNDPLSVMFPDDDTATHDEDDEGSSGDEPPSPQTPTSPPKKRQRQ